jgi:hypothetical protein
MEASFSVGQKVRIHDPIVWYHDRIGTVVQLGQCFIRVKVPDQRGDFLLWLKPEELRDVVQE